MYLFNEVRPMNNTEILQLENLTVENQELSQGELETISGGILPVLGGIGGKVATGIFVGGTLGTTVAFYDQIKAGAKSIATDINKPIANKLLNWVDKYADPA